MKPLSCNPAKLKGLSDKLIVSHYENNYGGAVKRLSAITAQLESLDFVAAPVFVINGLKREELIASNSMILHELYFASLSEESQPDGALRSAFTRDFGSVEKGQTQSVPDHFADSSNLRTGQKTRVDHSCDERHRTRCHRNPRS
jgi:Fe-Mn family superoxide dismutase